MRNDTYEQARAQIEAYDKGLSRIRNDPSLSDHGRRVAIGELYETTRTAVNKLKQGDQHATTSDRNQLRRQLFGGGDALADRDARQRVREARSAEQLAELMEQASIAGDRSMERAGFAYAYERAAGNDVFSDQWRALVDEYAEQNSHVVAPLAQLDQMSGNDLLANATAQMATVVKRPDELSQPVRDFTGGGPSTPAGEGGRPAAA